MKVKFIAFAVLMLSVALVFAQLPLKDVPVNHWAYDAVKTLVEAGVLSGMPDGTFQGNQPLTRYQAALAFKRLIDYLSKSLPYASSNDLGNIMADVEALKNLVSTTAERYQQLQTQVQTLQDEFSKLNVSNISNSKFAELEQRLNKLELSVGRVETVQSQLDEQIKTIAAEMASTSGRAKSAESTAKSVEANVENLAKRLAVVESKADRVSELVGSTNVAQLAALLNELDAKVRSMSSSMESVQKINDTLKTYETALSNLSLKAAKNSQDITNLDKSVKSIEEQFPTINENLNKSLEQLGVLSGSVSNLEVKVSNLEKKIAQTPWVAYTDERVDEVSKNLDKKINTATILGVAGMVLGAAGLGLGIYLFISSTGTAQ
ncbi:MAG: hypothetical protein PWQ20_1405 [Thermotogaceae bacterium]|jgi:chromosome segregation ATPase|nr:hypothetical protein [Thermotogaceae bacterium]MDN5338335.1 hypothetical protein [Thermotogaceae bacterium]